MLPFAEVAIRPHVMTCPCGGLTRPLGKPAPVRCGQCRGLVAWKHARFVGRRWECVWCLGLPVGIEIKEEQG